MLALTVTVACKEPPPEPEVQRRVDEPTIDRDELRADAREGLESAIDDPETLKKQVQSIPMKRAAKPEEIAHAAVFLTSEQARYIHGTTIFVDGALVLFQGQGA